MPFHKLIDGFRNFRENWLDARPELFDKLVRHGQSPEALVISCSDSRIDPAILTASDPGDLFVIRNVAAIVPPCEEDSSHHGTSSAIEYAVRALNVGHIIVMGHALCGGVKALLDREITEREFDFIGPWIDIGAETLDAVQTHLDGKDDKTRLRALEQAMVITSLKNLFSFPWVEKAVASKQLTLHGWYYDLAEGNLEAYDVSRREFIDILSAPLETNGPESMEDLDMEAFLKKV